MKALWHLIAWMVPGVVFFLGDVGGKRSGSCSARCRPVASQRILLSGPSGLMALDEYDGLPKYRERSLSPL